MDKRVFIFNLILTLQKSTTDANLNKHVNELKDEVRNMLITAADNSNDYVKMLELIDAIQRLGVSYHFENEVDENLRLIFDRFAVSAEEEDDIYAASLRFRLLRQQGYNVSCGESVISIILIS